MNTVLAALVAFSVTLLATPLVRAGARRFRLLDHPNARSSHSQVTPRAGGLAVLAGLTAALALAPGTWAGRPDLAAVTAGAAFVALVGLLDDRFGLPPWPRLACQVAAAALAVGATGGLDRLPLPPPLDVAVGMAGPALAVVWIVSVVNLYNFMDGIDGLASLQGLVTAGALGLAFGATDAGAATLAMALAAGCAAFLVFNWSPASVFLGDAGSGLLGYTLASLPLLVRGDRRTEAVVLVGASLFLFLADATSCLMRRIWRGERWHEAHREHLYQRWTRTGVRHSTVTGWLGVGAVATTGLALVAWRAGAALWYWAALLVGAGIVAAEMAFVRRLEHRAPPGR